MDYVKLGMLGLQLEQLIDESDASGLVDVKRMEELLSIVYDEQTTQSVMNDIIQGKVPQLLFDSLAALNPDQQKLVGMFVNRLVTKLENKAIES